MKEKQNKYITTENENEFIVYYKDDATAFNGEKKAQIASKGILNNKISTIMFETLARRRNQNSLHKKLIR